MITLLVLALQAKAVPGKLPHEMDHVETLRVQVHQASGMLSEQLDIDIADAFAQIRAHAYAEGRSVNDVAAEVVAGTLRIR